MIRAASVLCPSPSPETTPAPMAITFFAAPASSTPTTSEEEYRRSVGLASVSRSSAASAMSSLATTAAEGAARASSAAKVGPEKAAKRSGVPARPHSSAETRLMRASDSPSIPLVAETTVSGCREPRTSRKSRSTDR